MENITRQYYLPATLIAKHNLNRLCHIIPCQIMEIKRISDFIAVILSFRKGDTNIVEHVLEVRVD